MKKYINKICTSILGKVNALRLPRLTGDYFVSPKIPYFSQFASIQPATASPQTPILDRSLIKNFGATNEKDYNIWIWRACGIACVKMLLASENKADNKTLMDLINEGLELKGYILYDENGTLIDEGWFHDALVKLLSRYGVSASKKKWQASASVANDILANRKIILSLRLPTRRTIKEDGSFETKKDPKYCGHLIIATGVKLENGNIQGFYLHDPRGLENYQENSFISLPMFNKYFSNRSIVCE